MALRTLLVAALSAALCVSCGETESTRNGPGDAGSTGGGSNDAGTNNNGTLSNNGGTNNVGADVGTSGGSDTGIDGGETEGAVCTLDETAYEKEFEVTIDCDGISKAVVEVTNTRKSTSEPLPRAISSAQARDVPAVIGDVTVLSGTAAWDRIYFFAQCSSPGVHPGGIAFELPSSGGSYVSCYAGAGHDQGETEPCVEVDASGNAISSTCKAILFDR